MADANQALSDLGWLWDQWIQKAALSAIVSDPGIGKTRFVIELCWRLYIACLMPDGSPNRFPAGTKTLWMLYDRNWRGVIRAATSFGLPLDAILLPTHKGKPLWLPDFDEPSTMDILRGMIEAHKPGALIIDSTTYASAYNTGKPNESKLAFDPIMDILMETDTAGIGIAHTNAQGGVLNLRMLERVRTKIVISRPDPEAPKRLRIECDKSDEKLPPAIGAEFTDTAVLYDHNPPSTPIAALRGRKATTSPGLAQFLEDFLQPGPAAVVDIVKAARDQGLLKSPTDEKPTPSISPLYDARKWYERAHQDKIIDEFLAPSSKRPVGKGKLIASSAQDLKHWQIIDKPDSERTTG
jgi:hypothetical protein